MAGFPTVRAATATESVGIIRVGDVTSPIEGSTAIPIADCTNSESQPRDHDQNARSGFILPGVFRLYAACPATL